MIDSVSDVAGASADLKKARRQKTARADARSTVDRLPPHDLDMEKGVLGCQLLSPNDCVGEVIEKLRGIGAEAHYDLKNQVIQTELLEMYENRIPIDLITLQQRLKDKQLLEQIGGIVYLTQLQDHVPSAANLGYYLDIVREKFLLRKMISTCTEIAGRAYDCDGETDALLDEAERTVLAVRPQKISAESTPDLLLEAVARIERKMTGTGTGGLSTGLTDVDRLTDGLHGGELITVAALPSCGKSSLAAQIATHNALNGVPVMFFSAEMMPVQLMIRSICSIANVNFHALNASQIGRITSAVATLSKSPLYIERASGMSIGEIQAIMRRMMQKQAIKIVVVDYAQLIGAPGDNLEQRISAVGKGCKQIALEHDLTVILLSQLNKDGDTKYAVALKEHSDSLWKIKNEGEWESESQPVNLIVEKCRDGQTGSVPLTFLKSYTRFENAARISDEDVPKPYAD